MLFKNKEDQKVVDAFKWTGGPDQTEDPDWIVCAIKAGKVVFENQCTPKCTMQIMTAGDVIVVATPGDWIIKRDEEIFALTTAAFEATHEKFVYLTKFPDSKNVDSIDYLASKTVMTVKFRNGGEYQYFDVPEDVFKQFQVAKSPGVFMAESIKGKFRFAKVDCRD